MKIKNKWDLEKHCNLKFHKIHGNPVQGKQISIVQTTQKLQSSEKAVRICSVCVPVPPPLRLISLTFHSQHTHCDFLLTTPTNWPDCLSKAS